MFQLLVNYIRTIGQKFQHFWRLFDVSINHFLGYILAEQCTHQVFFCILCGIIRATGLRIVVDGNPDTPAGGRTCAPDLVGLLNN